MIQNKKNIQVTLLKLLTASVLGFVPSSEQYSDHGPQVRNDGYLYVHLQQSLWCATFTNQNMFKTCVPPNQSAPSTRRLGNELAPGPGLMESGQSSQVALNSKSLS